MPLTQGIKDKIMSVIRDYGTGRDTLRCLALATRDNPPSKDQLNLEDCTRFAEYEVNLKYSPPHTHIHEHTVREQILVPLAELYWIVG